MFNLTIHDRDGIELNIGDLVKISDGKRYTFYSKVQYLEKGQVLAPFHTFSFHSFVKVDKIPDNAMKNKCESDYDFWYINDDPEQDESAETFEEYLSSWLECDRLMESRCYRIALNPKVKSQRRKN